MMKLFYTHTPETHHYEIGFTIFGRTTGLFIYEQYPVQGIDCYTSLGWNGGYIGFGIGKVSFGVQILFRDEF